MAPLHPHPSVEQLVAHRRFHGAIYTASHNDLLIGTLEALWDKADRYRLLDLRTDPGQDARDQKAKEHDALVECVALGDSAGEADIMRKHIDTSLGATAGWRLGHADAADGT
ncbi:FCD domain-containing protein [Streptomyces sp. NPDC001658]